MARLPKGAEVLISMAFLVMCAEKSLRLIRFFFVTTSAQFYTWRRLGLLCVVLRNIFLLARAETMVTE
jgi:hypothetical protein